MEPVLVAAVRQVRHSDKSPKTMAKKKKHVPTNQSNPPVPKPKPADIKPVIAFYRNSKSSNWILFPRVCTNARIAKQRIHAETGSELVHIIDVPEDVKNG